MKTVLARTLPFDLLLHMSHPYHTAYRARKAYTRTGIAFIHIPKNAGTSVEFALYGQKLGHRTWREIKALAPGQFNDWEKWAVVREPIDRFLSAYDYLAGGGRNAWDAEFSRRFMQGKTIDEFILGFPHVALRWFHFRPQADYLLSNGKLMVDRVVTLKNLADLPVEIGHLNKTEIKKGRPRSQLHEESREAVLSIYSDDARLYNSIENGIIHPKLNS